ncbi:MAG: helix-turn-helix transcriptional regulator [Phycisphaerae bacterium]|nr:helix-turn-helix transcriptional regulator [Phycisphaerae bacterium]
MNVLVPQTGLRADYAKICERMKQLRVQVCGRRGQSKFAYLLGISPSTYNYYEKGRVPSVEILDLASKISGAPLMWLIRGEPESFNVQDLKVILGELPAKPKSSKPAAEPQGEASAPSA